MNNENDAIPKELQSSNWLKEARTPEGELKATSEFSAWLAELRHGQLAEKAARLWRVLRNGSLSGFEKALVVGALAPTFSRGRAIPPDRLLHGRSLNATEPGARTPGFYASPNRKE